MPKDKITSGDAEQIELRWKQVQIEEMEEKLAERKDKKDRIDATRARQIADYEKGEQEKRRRQMVCKHRKGGKDNRFAGGSGANYSINMNTYPNGRQVIFCTRCGKEVEKPETKLRKANPELYAKMWADWQLWTSYPTDNAPSGGKIFEVIEAANVA